MSSRLARALVSPDHEHLYQTNLGFKIAIDSLARFLPAMINGLAAEARASQTLREEWIKEQMEAHPYWPRWWEEDDERTEVTGVTD